MTHALAVYALFLVVVSLPAALLWMAIVTVIRGDGAKA